MKNKRILAFFLLLLGLCAVDIEAKRGRGVRGRARTDRSARVRHNGWHDRRGRHGRRWRHSGWGGRRRRWRRGGYYGGPYWGYYSWPYYYDYGYYGSPGFGIGFYI